MRVSPCATENIIEWSSKWAGGERERERLLPVKKLCHEEYNKKKKKKHSVIREGWKVVQRFHDHKKKKRRIRARHDSYLFTLTMM